MVPFLRYTAPRIPRTRTSPDTCVESRSSPQFAMRSRHGDHAYGSPPPIPWSGEASLKIWSCYANFKSSLFNSLKMHCFYGLWTQKYLHSMTKLSGWLRHRSLVLINTLVQVSTNIADTIRIAQITLKPVYNALMIHKGRPILLHLDPTTNPSASKYRSQSSSYKGSKTRKLSPTTSADFWSLNGKMSDTTFCCWFVVVPFTCSYCLLTN